MTAFTKTLTDFVQPHDGAGKAVLVDGTGATVDFGVMGNFGSNLGSGLYLKFDLLSDFTGDGTLIGTGSSGQQFFKIGLNNGGTDRFTISLRDNAGLNLSGRITLATKDRQKRNIEIQLTPSTNTIQVWVDGVAQTVTYTAQQTPATFVNFPRRVTLGSRDNGFGTLVEGSRAIVDNLRIGTTSSNLYGSYGFEDVSFPVADASGNSNNGAAVGTPKLVLGFEQMPKGIGKYLTDTLSFIETLTKFIQIHKAFFESVTLTETFQKNAHKLFVEEDPEIYLVDENGDHILDENGDYYQVAGAGLNLTEYFQKSIKKSFTEQITLVEFFTKIPLLVARTIIFSVQRLKYKSTFQNLKQKLVFKKV